MRSPGQASARRSEATGRRLMLLPHPEEPDAKRFPVEVDESKIRVPALRSGLVSKTALVNRLRANVAFPLVVVTAPAGYGKTTLLAQWAERDDRPFAWVSVNARDTEPLILLRHVAAALHAFDPLEPHVLAALARPGDSIWTTVVPRLGAALSELREPPVIVLDNADLLRSRASVEAVDALANHLPGGAVLALAGRTAPHLPLAELRAGGKLLEVGVDDLALTPKEAKLLLKAAGAKLTVEEAC